MANVALSPSMTARLKTKECINRIKNGSPKLQQVLREKCRQRMREKRGQLFNKSRFGLEIDSKDVQNALTEIVRKEFKSLATSEWAAATNMINEPLNAQQALELENELINEEEEWILQEYDNMSKAELELMSLTADQQGEVLCPMCQASTLFQEMNSIVCRDCDFTLNTSITVKELGHLISECVNNHAINCLQPPGFATVVDNNNDCFYMTCHLCSTLALII